MTPFSAIPAGTRLGPYQLGELLGKGGMGEVYLAQDTRLGRRVAVKVLPPDATRNPELIGRFEQEARAASARNHPNILTIYDFGLSVEPTTLRPSTWKVTHCAP